MRPPWRRRIPGKTSWVSRTRPKKLVSNWRRISAIGTCSTGPYSPYPALLISVPTAPASASTAATASVMEVSSVTSSGSVAIPRAARSASVSARLAVAYTRSPAPCRLAAAARPIPDEQPVMRTGSVSAPATMLQPLPAILAAIR